MVLPYEIFKSVERTKVSPESFSYLVAQLEASPFGDTSLGQEYLLLWSELEVMFALNAFDSDRVETVLSAIENLLVSFKPDYTVQVDPDNGWISFSTAAQFVRREHATSLSTVLVYLDNEAVKEFYNEVAELLFFGPVTIQDFLWVETINEYEPIEVPVGAYETRVFLHDGNVILTLDAKPE